MVCWSCADLRDRLNEAEAESERLREENERVEFCGPACYSKFKGMYRLIRKIHKEADYAEPFEGLCSAGRLANITIMIEQFEEGGGK